MNRERILVKTLRKIVADAQPDNQAVGKVVSATAGMVRIQLIGKSGFAYATANPDLKLGRGDTVALMRPSSRDRWIILNRISDSRSSSASGGQSVVTPLAIAPPSNFRALSGLAGHILAAWDVPPQFPGVFEVQYNASGASGTDGDQISGFTTGGGLIAFPETVPRWLRVRSVNVNFQYSGWSNWLYGTPYAGGGGGGGGSGTVTSVALTVPSHQSVSGSPITSAGTLAITENNQSANQVFAGPGSGAAAAPGFRGLVQADLPVMTGDSGSGGVKGAVPAPSAGDASLAKFLRADATWAVPGGASGATSVPPTDIQIFTASGTWTKPTGAISVQVLLLAAGGGGGSGRRGAAASNRGGGGGGGGGGFMPPMVFPASDLPSTVNVTVGAGGTGGAAVTVNDTAGNAGGSGGDTYFGASVAAAYVRATGAGGGGGGTTSGGTGGAGGGGIFSGGNGGGGSIGNSPGSAGVTTGSYSSGGGGGGGLNTSNTASAGGVGGLPIASSGHTPPPGGTVPGGTGTNGAGTGSTSSSPSTTGGGGGGAGTAAGGAGGVGGRGSGGGGGAASLNGNNSGAGGNGGTGLIVVITYF